MNVREKMKIIAITASLLILGCTSKRLTAQVEEPEKAKLVLTVGRAGAKWARIVQPSNVALTGRLSEGLDLEDYYCSIIEWDINSDGHPESINEPTMNCNGVQRVFFKIWPFREYGDFTVKLTLKNSLTRKVLASDTVRIVIERPGEEDGREQ